MSFGGVQYSLKQFHFHLPSEHLDNGLSMAMEMHMVWQGGAGEVAVIGAFIDLDAGAAAATNKTTEKRLSVRERKRLAARVAAADEGAADSPLPGIENSFFHVNDPKTAAAASSNLLETVLGGVEKISKPGSVTKTPPLVMSELVNTLLSGSFRT
jgi:carbonic anhydrase